MEYELKDAGPCRRLLIINFTTHDIDTAFDESYAEINNYVQLKGFRKGKAPRRTLEKRFTAEAATTARDSLTERTIPEIIKNEKLHVIGNIINKNPNDKPSPNQNFRMEIVLDVAPDIDLPEYKSLEITSKPLEVSDNQVDEAIERYRKIFANYDSVEEPAKEGDVLMVDFIARVEGQEIMNMTEQRLRIEGDKMFGLPCPDLVEKFTGAEVGNVIELTVTMPSDHPEHDLRDKPAQIEVTIKTVERGQLPEVNDQFAEGLGMGTLAAFRDRIKENLVREAVLETRSKQEEEIIDSILGHIQLEIPADMIQPEADALIEQRRNRLARSGVGADQIAAQLGTYHPEALKQAERKIRWGIVAAKIGDKEEISVTNEDLNAQIEALAASYRTTPAKIAQRIREFNGIGPMAEEILSLKVVQFIIDHSKGGRLDPDRQDADTEKVNADAALSVAEAESATEQPGNE